MGLDMTVMTVPAALIGNAQVDIDLEPHKALVNGDFAYWRKHHDLHGWMRQLYRDKQGANEDFNCDTVRLMPADLDRLEADIKAKALPSTQGFFFGSNPPDPESDKDDLAFIANARQAQSLGLAVIYSSWW